MESLLCNDNSRFCIPRLVMEERIAQLLDDGCGSAEEAEQAIREDLGGKFDLINEITDIDSDTILRLFKKRHQSGFKDTAIMLSLIKYAKSSISPGHPCIFVTQNLKDFDRSFYGPMAKDHGVPMFVVGPDELAIVLGNSYEMLEKTIDALIQADSEISAIFREQILPTLIRDILENPAEHAVAHPTQLIRCFDKGVNRESLDQVYTQHKIQHGYPLSKPSPSELTDVAFRIDFHIYIPGIVARWYATTGTADIRTDDQWNIENIDNLRIENCERPYE